MLRLVLYYLHEKYRMKQCYTELHFRSEWMDSNCSCSCIIPNLRFRLDASSAYFKAIAKLPRCSSSVASCIRTVGIFALLPTSRKQTNDLRYICLAASRLPSWCSIKPRLLNIHHASSILKAGLSRLPGKR